MTDFQIFAPDMATMVAASKMIGNWREPDPEVPGDPGGFIGSSRMGDGSVFALNIYGTKYKQTGTTVDANGHESPVMEALPGVYGIGRWSPSDGISDPPSPPGVTVTPIPDDSPIRWA